MKVPKICFVTANRSEYGLLRWTMERILKADDLEFKLIVTGTHLSKKYGYTVNEIIEDGFKIDACIDMELDSDESVKIARSLGICAVGMAEALEVIQPDCLIVLGDRYELLPICSIALIMRIPILHISGGDITEGAIDNEIRNAISMMAIYHFPGTLESANRLALKGINANSIFVVGEPGLESFKRMTLLSRKDLSLDLDLDMEKKWLLFTFHPETKITLEENLLTVRIVLEKLIRLTDCQIIATYANADSGGIEINAILESYASKFMHRIKVVKSLGQKRYLSLMNECVMVVGNSSSGIVEAPIIGIPVLNIGQRQSGRHFCKNIISCNIDDRAIEESIIKIIKGEFSRFDPDYYYGNGDTSMLITEKIRENFLRGE